MRSSFLPLRSSLPALPRATQCTPAAPKSASPGPLLPASWSAGFEGHLLSSSPCELPPPSSVWSPEVSVAGAATSDRGPCVVAGRGARTQSRGGITPSSHHARPGCTAEEWGRSASHRTHACASRTRETTSESLSSHLEGTAVRPAPASEPTTPSVLPAQGRSERT